MPKRLDDPKEFKRIQDVYFEPRFVSDESNEELMEREAQKRRLSNNQAR